MNPFIEYYLMGGAVALTVFISGTVWWMLPRESSSESIPTKAQPELKNLSDVSSKEEKPEFILNGKPGFWRRVSAVFVQGQTPEVWRDNIEEVLYTSDLGPRTVQALMAAIDARALSTEIELKERLKSKMTEIFSALRPLPSLLEPDLSGSSHQVEKKPQLWMIAGINGAGKTTTLGKIAAHLKAQGKSVLIVAGDTFRAAAEQQLKAWAERANVHFFELAETRDPSAVTYQGIDYAIKLGVDIVLLDTAGRLHTQAHLMEELKKVSRTVQKKLGRAADERLLVLDANQGQNALMQAGQFHEALQLTGVVLTKMDGSAKGGIAVAVAHDLKIPVRLIGTGEAVGDIRPFEANAFIEALLSD